MVVLPHYPIHLQKSVVQGLPETEVVDLYLATLHRFFFPESLSGLLNTFYILSIHKMPMLKNVLCGENAWYQGFESLKSELLELAQLHYIPFLFLT